MSLVLLPRQFLADNSGTPRVGAKLYVFNAGTTTPRTSYPTQADAVAGTNAQSHPVLSITGGLFPAIYINQAAGDYKLVLKDSADVTLYTEDGIPAQLLTQDDLGKVLYPRTSAEIAAGVTPTSYPFWNGPFIDAVGRFGLIGDGITDNAAALVNAIKVADASGLPLLIRPPAAFYRINSSIVQSSLSKNLRIIGLGNPEFRYTGANTAYFVHLQDTNGHDVNLEGITLNANQKACRSLRIDNPSASMAASEIGRVIVTQCSFINGYLHTGLTQAASGVLCAGGYSEIVFQDCNVRNINRDTGSGTPGSLGCYGLAVSSSDINGYCRKFSVLGGVVDTVTNQETAGSADDVDCDGIIYAVPWNSPALPDTEYRCDDGAGGIGWEGERFRESSRLKQSS